MLKNHKVLKLAILICLCLIIITIPVVAAVSAPEITISTDKTEYTGDDTITAVIDVNNVTGNDMKDIVISGAVPTGYATDDGVAGPDNWSAKLSKVAAGSTESVTIKFTKQASDEVMAPEDTKTSGDQEISNDSVDQNDQKEAEVTPVEDKPAVAATDNNVRTGDDSEPMVFVVLAALSLAGMILLVRSKKGKRILSICLAVAVAGGTLMVRGSANIFAATSDMVAGTPEFAEDESDRAIAGEASKNGNVENGTAKASATIKIDGKETTIDVSIDYDIVTGSQDLSYEGYILQWQDEFEGESLNRDDWNVETHNAGWVNAELQAYVDSEENIYLKDGSLVLKSVKDGDSYTSGRVNTQGKHDFKYGLFEAKVKVPSGMGYLPAFWLMPTDENLYGQWPRCGEIDAMEVMGQETDKVYGSLHYGNPKSDSQGTKKLTDGDFSEEYHVFAVEWEPGSMKWYVDGMLYHEEHDWYTATVGQGTVTYPAPFDQQFYVILNLAIGGEWVGYPDENTTYEDQAFEIDYVRVFQKDEYDENVERPEQAPVVLRDADATGNYIINGDFSVNEALNDEEDWVLLTALGGVATAKIENGVLRIDSTAAGSADYSVQFVQAGLPAEKGATYRLSFDAWADAERTAKVNIDAVDRGYTRYLPDTKIDLTAKKQSFSFEYTMTDENDGNSRLEFNLGNTASTATVYIDNVRLEKIAQSEVADKKGVLADGNYVYNGKFQEGAGRLAYWDIENKAGAQISVTNDEEHDRRLKIVAPEGTSAENPVIVSQGDLALSADKAYAISYDADGEPGKTIKATLAGEALDADLTGKSQTLSKAFTTGEKVDNSVVFTITAPGTYYIDNVSIVEDSLIKNGSFDAGTISYDPFIDSSAEATYGVDSLAEGNNNAFEMTISNTGDADWKVQLKQSGVRLEEGQWYRLSLDMRSSKDRKVVVAIQRNGNVYKTADGAEDWQPYVQNTAELTSEYKTFTYEFKMDPNTEPKSDDGAIFNVAMGAVNGAVITEKHTVDVDNIKLEKIDAPANEQVVEDVNILDDTKWENNSVITVTEEGVTTITMEGVGSNPWDRQLGQQLTLKKGAKYKLSFKAKSSVERDIQFGVQEVGGDYTTYGSAVNGLSSEEKAFEVEFTMTEDDEQSQVFFNMGNNVGDKEQPAATITISDVQLVEVETN
jgi:beta-glucanase (GH16 family)